MDAQIILALTGLLTAVFGGSWFTSVVLRRKYLNEIEILKADAKKKNTDTAGSEIDNMEKTLKIQVEYIVEPLKKEINVLRKRVIKLHRALENIGVCPHAPDCPVRRELQSDEDND